MSTELKPFAFEDHLVRVVMQGDEPWFILADVCRALGIGNPSMAAEKLDADERDTLNSIEGTTDQNAPNIVSESGLYTIILRSRAATTPGSVAHRFRKWVTADVLPSIRKTGRYEAPGRGDEDADEHSGLGLGPLSEVAVRARLVEMAERISGKPAARALWRRLGLPWVEEMDEASVKVLEGREAEPDPVALFAVEGVQRERSVTTPAHVLWTGFVKFCLRNDLPTPSQKAFFMRFAAMGFTKRRVGGRIIYQGLRLVAAQEADAGA